jgi:hypothetical protein
VVDPLVMPIGAMGTAGQQVFRLVRRLHRLLRTQTALRVTHRRNAQAKHAHAPSPWRTWP